MTQRKLSLIDVQNSYKLNSREPFVVKAFARPIADRITPVLYNIGFSANGVTYTRCCISFLAVAAILFDNFVAFSFSVFLFYLGFILDCVDGNIARVTDSATYWGKFIDGIVDYVFINLAPLAVGYISFIFYDSIHVLVLGFFSSFLSSSSQMVRARLSFFREWMVAQSGPIDPEMERELDRIRGFQKVLGSVYVNGTFLAPLLMLVGEGGRWFVYGLVLVQMVPESFWLGTSILEGKKLLSRRRRSIKSAL